MSKMMHTPRPWVYCEQTKTIRSKKENYWLATMDSWDGSVNNAANARLISAAPDLLAALEGVIAKPRCLEMWIRARAAVAKAKGETE